MRRGILSTTSPSIQVEGGESAIMKRELVADGKTSTEKRNRREPMKAEEWYIDIFIAKNCGWMGMCDWGSRV